MESAAVEVLIKLIEGLQAHHILLVLITLGFTPFGVVCMIVWLWIGSERRRNETIKIYRDDVKSVLESYGKDVRELTEFYRKNVELVNAWKRIAEGFQETVVLNTQTWTTVCDMIKTNQFCPQARLPK